MLLIGEATIALSNRVKERGSINQPQGDVQFCIKGKAKAFDQFCARKHNSKLCLNSSIHKDIYNLGLLCVYVWDFILHWRQWFLCYVLYPRCFPVHSLLTQNWLDMFSVGVGVIKTFLNWRDMVILGHCTLLQYVLLIQTLVEVGLCSWRRFCFPLQYARY